MQHAPLQIHPLGAPQATHENNAKLVMGRIGGFHIRARYVYMCTSQHNPGQTHMHMPHAPAERPGTGETTRLQAKDVGVVIIRA